MQQRIIVTLVALCLIGVGSATTLAQQDDAKQDVAAVLDTFHQAASEADLEAYFNCFAPNAVFIGTDAAERWTLDAFLAFCKPYFDRGVGWTYTPTARHIQVNAGSDTAWFDELLDNEKYGVCRGTGVLLRTNDGWKIVQYTLSMPVPNEVAGDVVRMIRGGESEAITVYLVRHAEQENRPGDRDPALSDEGEARAERLALMLRSTPIDSVFSSDFRRTHQTAAPVATMYEREVQLYNPLQPQSLADRVIAGAFGRRVLITGHSNTVPTMLTALGVQHDITLEESDYDNLFIVTIAPDGQSTLTRLHY